MQRLKTSHIKSISNTEKTSGRASPRCWRVLVAVVVGMMLVASGISPAQAARATQCDDVKIIFARGSGERIGDVSNMTWRSALNSALSDSKLKFGFYELGSSAQNGYRYPAVSVSDSWGGFGTMIGAFVSGGTAHRYGDSVSQGMGELIEYVGKVSSTCPQTEFVLGGYSQGAQVISRTLPHLNHKKIIYAATFGDPKLYLPEGEGWDPPACSGRDLSDYRVHVPDCHAFEGILGGYQPYETRSYVGKLGTWCNGQDIMCSSGASLEDHTSYVSAELYTNAAQHIRTKLKAAYPRAFRRKTPAIKQDTVLLLDTSASMYGRINEYLAEALDLARQVTAADGKVAVVVYRDLAEAFMPELLVDLTNNYDKIEESLQNLVINGGGDDNESLLSAAYYALKNVSWENGVAKSLIAVTDAGYHEVDYDGITLQDVVKLSMEIDPVNISVLTLPEVGSRYTELTRKTGGRVYDLTDKVSQAKLTQDVTERPEAKLSTSEYSGVVGDTIRFDASDSAALDGGALTYAWDFDGDGEFELDQAGPIVNRKFTEPTSSYVQVKVTDRNGRVNTMSAHLWVHPSRGILPQITQAEAQPLADGSFKITYQTVKAERVLVAIDDAPVGYARNGRQSFVVSGGVRSVRLIPYHSWAGRGAARELKLTKNDQPEDAPDSNAGSGQLGENPANDASHTSNSSQTANPNRPTHVVGQAPSSSETTDRQPTSNGLASGLTDSTAPATNRPPRAPNTGVPPAGK